MLPLVSPDCIALNGKMIGEYWIGKDLKKSGHILIKVPQHFPGGTEENHKKNLG
jgi:hypothetical protein